MPRNTRLEPNLVDVNDCFTKTFNTYYKRLCAYAFQFVGEQNTSEDLVQNTFVKLWTKRSNVDFLNCKGLLYKMVRESSYDYLRSRKKLAGMKELEYVPDNSLKNEIIYSETFQELLIHIEQLSPKRGAIVYQLFVQQKDNSEVAKEFNIKESTVRKQKEKAIEYFKSKFNKIAFLLFITIISVNY